MREKGHTAVLIRPNVPLSPLHSARSEDLIRLGSLETS